MRLKTDLIHLDIGEEHLLVDPDGGAVNLTNLFTLNEATAYLWEQFVGRDFTPQQMADRLAEIYNVSPEQALTDVQKLLKTWDDFGLIV